MLDYTQSEPAGAFSMEYVTQIVDGPLGELFATWREPVWIIDDQRQVLFQNEAAVAFLKASPTLEVTNATLYLSTATATNFLSHTIQADQHPNNVWRAQLYPFLSIDAEWLLSVTPLPMSLAVLHPVYVVNLMSRQQLSNTAHTILSKAAQLTHDELQLIDAWLAKARAPTATTQSDSHKITAAWRRLLNKCESHSPMELLTLLHRLTQLCC